MMYLCDDVFLNLTLLPLHDIEEIITIIAKNGYICADAVISLTGWVVDPQDHREKEKEKVLKMLWLHSK